MSLDDDDPDGAEDMDFLGQLRSFQENLASAQTAASSRTVTGEAGGGVVQISATGAPQFSRVLIDPEVVDPGDVGLLEDLILAALRDLSEKLEELRREEVGAVMNDALGGLLGAMGMAVEEDDDFDEDDEDDGTGEPGDPGPALG